MPKFFISPDDIKNGQISLTGEDVRHIRKVLRHREGDILSLSDGCGTDYEGEITSITLEEVSLRVLSSHVSEVEPPMKVTLFQCVPKSGKMDFVVQKCTELGISSIVPVISERIVAAPEKEQKILRYRKIAEEAAKQSGRGCIPTVEMPIPYDEMLSRISDFDLFLMPYEGAKEGSLKEALKTSPKTIGVLVGPEGGFEPFEVDSAKEKGAVIITLGKRILRCETAGAAVQAMLLYELEL